MTGITAVVAALGASGVSNAIAVTISDLGTVNATSASGITAAMTFTPTFPVADYDSFIYSITSISGGKISINEASYHAPTAGSPMSYRFSWAGLSVGEQATGIFELNVSKSPYDSAAVQFSVTVSRTS